MASRSETPVAAAETANNDTPSLTLRSSDGEEFLVAESAAALSQTIKQMAYEANGECEKRKVVFPLANVDSKTLSTIIVYLNKHADGSLSASEMKAFDDEFFNEMSLSLLLDCVLAANYLHIQDLLDAVCVNIADRIKDYSRGRVAELFNVDDDFTPEELEELKKENGWAFEGVPDD